MLYPARVRDLLLRLAIAGHYRARWSERILDECFSNLVADRPDLPAKRLDRTRGLMNVAVPDAIVRDYEHLIEQLDLPDPSDRHVVAAVVASADIVVTSNLGDFPAPAVPPGITVLSPDDFILRLIHADLEAVATVIEQQAAALRNPPMTTTELLDGLAIVGLTSPSPPFARPRREASLFEVQQPRRASISIVRLGRPGCRVRGGAGRAPRRRPAPRQEGFPLSDRRYVLFARRVAQEVPGVGFELSPGPIFEVLRSPPRRL